MLHLRVASCTGEAPVSWFEIVLDRLRYVTHARVLVTGLAAWLGCDGNTSFTPVFYNPQYAVDAGPMAEEVSPADVPGETELGGVADSSPPLDASNALEVVALEDGTPTDQAEPSEDLLLPEVTDATLDTGPPNESGFCGSVVHPSWSRSLDRIGGTVVFTELMLGEPAWIELHNPMAVAVDLSDWSVTGAMETVFEDGTFIEPGAYLVVPSASGPLPVGEGKLTLLSNTGRRMDSVGWEDAEPWPAGSFGTGASLSKRDPTALSEAAESWSVGPVGGTPGAANVATPAVPAVVVAVPEKATWRYHLSGLAAPGWSSPGFDASAWPHDTAIFAGGVAEPAPELVTFRVTADNHFAIYLGAADGTKLRLVGRDTAGDWTSPEVFSGQVGPGDHLFLAGWEAAGDSDSPQMLIGEAVASDGEVLFRTQAGSVEWVLGPLAAGPGGNLAAPPPAVEALATWIATNTDTWTAPEAAAPRESSPWGWAVADDFSAGTSYVWPDTFSSNSITNQNETYVLFRSSGPVLPPPGDTVLGTVPVTSRFITTFTPPPGTVDAAWLDLRVDDGAVIWLNGQEVHRQNLPVGAVNELTPAVESVTDASLTPAITLPAALVVPGQNVLAVEVHDAADGQGDLLFSAAVTLVVTPESDAPPPSPLTGLELSEVAPTWVELVNGRDTPIDVGGVVLAVTGSPAMTLAEATLAPGERLVVEVTAPGSGHALLYSPDQGVLLDHVRLLGAPRARTPHGEWRFIDATTPGQPNAFPAPPTIAINEVMYHHAPTLEPGGTLPTESHEEWVELHNWGPSDVDVGGFQLVDAIRFVVPSGTVIPAGGYLVVAGDHEAMQLSHPALPLVGEFKGSLGNGGERLVLRDDCGNPVDIVPYVDGGTWPAAADGGGSSLERRDPRSDGSSPASWAPSDSAPSGEWTTVVIDGVAAASAVGPDGQWEELVLGLLDDGTVLLDDVSVIEDPLGTPVELIANGTFDDLTAWRALGNHRYASVVADPDAPENAVLKLNATGPTEHMHNHLETTFVGGRSLQNGKPYRVSFRARWVSGSNLLNSRLYFNRLAHTERLPIPTHQGTPGTANSAATANIGPSFRALRHWPPIPTPGQPITVSVEADDPDGVSSVSLWTSAHGTTPMTATGSGRYEATLSGQPGGAIVQMVVTATDAQGSSADFPAAGKASRALFKVSDGGEQGEPGLHELRLIVTPEDEEWLFETTNLMSNDLVGATVVVAGREVFYDVGVRIKGSQRGRPQSNRVGFGVRFDPAHPFRGVYHGFNVDRSEGVGYGQREMLMGAVMARAGSVSTEYNDLAHLVAPRPEHTGPAELQLARFGDLLLETQFEGGGDGMLYEYELIYYPSTTDDGTPEGLKHPQPDDVVGTSIKDLGDDPERYRQNFILKNNRWRDDYGPLIAFAKVLGLKGASFEAAVAGAIDVDQWLRAFAFATLSGAIDNYASGAQHNGVFYQRLTDGRMLYFPHDLDFYGGSTESPIVNTGDLGKLVKVPVWKRRYYAELLDVIDRSYNADYAGYWCDHLGSLLPAQDFEAHCSFIHARSAWVESQILSQVPPVEFTVTTPAGEVSAGAATIEGTAWLDVDVIATPGFLDVTWTTPSTWTATVQVACGPNVLEFEAFDRAGQPAGTRTLALTGVGPDCP